jgi:hypothetical protein
MTKNYQNDIVTQEIIEDVADRNQDEWVGWRKTQGNWVVEMGWWMPRVEVADDICMRRLRLSQSCRAAAADYDDDGSVETASDFHHQGTESSFVGSKATGM